MTADDVRSRACGEFDPSLLLDIARRPKRRIWREVTTGVAAGGRRLELNLFSHIQSVVHLNAEISDGAFQFGMTK